MRAFSMYHPSVLFAYFIGVALLTLLTRQPFLLAFSLLGAILFAAMLESKKAVLVSMGFYGPMFLLIAAVNPLFSHNGVTPLFFLNDNPVTLEAIIYGAAIAGMIISILYWCRCYNSVMSSDKFIYLFGKIIPKLSLILAMALRFVPLFLIQIRKIHRTQKTMGLYATTSVVDRLRGRLRVFSAMYHLVGGKCCGYCRLDAGQRVRPAGKDEFFPLPLQAERFRYAGAAGAALRLDGPGVYEGNAGFCFLSAHLGNQAVRICPRRLWRGAGPDADPLFNRS